MDPFAPGSRCPSVTSNWQDSPGSRSASTSRWVHRTTVRGPACISCSTKASALPPAWGARASEISGRRPPAAHSGSTGLAAAHIRAGEDHRVWVSGERRCHGPGLSATSRRAGRSVVPAPLTLSAGLPMTNQDKGHRLIMADARPSLVRGAAGKPRWPGPPAIAYDIGARWRQDAPLAGKDQPARGRRHGGRCGGAPARRTGCLRRHAGRSRRPPQRADASYCSKKVHVEVTVPACSPGLHGGRGAAPPRQKSADGRGPETQSPRVSGSRHRRDGIGVNCQNGGITKPP